MPSGPSRLGVEPSRRARGPATHREDRGVLRMVVPPILAQRSSVGIARIEDPVLRFAPFAYDQQADLRFSVVEEAVRNPRAGRKSNRVARLQSMEMAVEPKIGSPSMTYTNSSSRLSACGKDVRRPGGSRS